MDIFFRAASAVLVTAVLGLTVGAQNKPFSSLLSMAVCVMVLLVGVSFLEPVIDFLNELEALGKLQAEYIHILLKAALICIITETASLICSDGGSASLAQTLKLLSSCAILWIAMPVFRGLVDLVHRILEGI